MLVAQLREVLANHDRPATCLSASGNSIQKVLPSCVMLSTPISPLIN